MKLTKTAKRGAKRAAKAVRRRRRGPSTAERVGKIAGGLGIAGALALVLAKIDRRKVAGRAKGAVKGVRGRKDYDDVTLARKVESELFRPADVPKGEISVNVNDGVVELRGELADQAQIDELADTARKVSGVKDVRNLLHAGTNSG
jgi:osmotically-inducible protein OsmY